MVVVGQEQEQQARAAFYVSGRQRLQTSRRPAVQAPGAISWPMLAGCPSCEGRAARNPRYSQLHFLRLPLQLPCSHCGSHSGVTVVGIVPTRAGSATGVSRGQEYTSAQHSGGGDIDFAARKVGPYHSPRGWSPRLPWSFFAGTRMIARSYNVLSDS